MIHPFTEVQLVMARSALNVLISNYASFEAKETIPAHKEEMKLCRENGERLLEKFRRLSPGDTDLTHGEVLVLERALRMSAAKWQQLITTKMSAEQKAFHRLGAEDVSDEIKRIRQLRGLPW